MISIVLQKLIALAKVMIKDYVMISIVFQKLIALAKVMIKVM